MSKIKKVPSGERENQTRWAEPEHTEVRQRAPEVRL